MIVYHHHSIRPIWIQIASELIFLADFENQTISAFFEAIRHHKIEKPRKIILLQVLMQFHSSILKISPAQAAREVGLDVELAPASEYIWHDSNVTYIGADNVQTPIQPEPEVLKPEAVKETQEPQEVKAEVKAVEVKAEAVVAEVVAAQAKVEKAVAEVVAEVVAAEVKVEETAKKVAAKAKKNVTKAVEKMTKPRKPKAPKAWATDIQAE